VSGVAVMRREKIEKVDELRRCVANRIIRFRLVHNDPNDFGRGAPPCFSAPGLILSAVIEPFRP
jgi:hypothetical protein